MYDIMLDLETLDTRESAIVTAIGAVKFNRTTFQIVGKFYRKLRWFEQEEKGRTLSARTVHWWMQQSEEARKEMMVGAETVDPVLADFAAFYYGDYIKDGYLPLWGNGSDFDNKILGDLFRTFGHQPPWGYKQNRCFRTVKNEWPVEEPAREGVHHNALDDALHQVKHLKLIKESIKANANV